MFLTPTAIKVPETIIAKTAKEIKAEKLAEVAKKANKEFNEVAGFLRRDGLNRIKAPKAAETTNVFPSGKPVLESANGRILNITL